MRGSASTYGTKEGLIEEKLLKHECLEEFNGIGDSVF
jgi:hypothetical protein